MTQSSAAPPRGEQANAIRGMGAATASFTRGSRRLSIAAVRRREVSGLISLSEFFTRIESK
jgi:hypothetical protein